MIDPNQFPKPILPPIQYSNLIFKTVKFKTGYSEKDTANYYISKVYYNIWGQIQWVDLECIFKNTLSHYSEHLSVPFYELKRYNKL